MTAVLFLLRAIVLVLLWGFVIAAVVAVRHDVFGTRRRSTAPAAPAQPATPAAKPASRKTRGAPRKLVVVEGSLAGQSFPLTQAGITIGRAEDSTVVLSDDYVSTRHARLLPRGEDWIVEDLGSTNGTYLDRRRISAATPIPPGGRIQVGKTVMELRS
ncbi:MAG: FHA domain-containing protein [Frankiales bacterium]|nr:FHA domain-containing protein [Frankiales bacterium]